jgi:hypothetical protein
MLKLTLSIVLNTVMVFLTLSRAPVSAFSRTTLLRHHVHVRQALFYSSGPAEESSLPQLRDDSILPPRQLLHEQRKNEWIDRSVNYYGKVMREERRRTIGQAPAQPVPPEYQSQFVHLAKKHYFALTKVKTGNFQHAEGIYRRIIDELTNEESEDDHCKNAQLAVTTLLLALLLQRMGDNKRTRSVFLNFFRMAVVEKDGETECACSAKVLQAFALFEMKQGNAQKSLELVNRAIQFDPSLAPVLQWKQFRDVSQRKAKM